MKIKLYSLIIVTAITSTGAMAARVTDADVARDAAWFAEQNTAITASQDEINKQWEEYNKPPNEIGKNTIVSTHYAQNRQTILKPTSSHICVIGRAGGEYHRGLKGINVDVFQSGGYWYLNAALGGNNNWGSATCWNK